MVFFCQCEAWHWISLLYFFTLGSNCQIVKLCNCPPKPKPILPTYHLLMFLMVLPTTLKQFFRTKSKNFLIILKSIEKKVNSPKLERYLTSKTFGFYFKGYIIRVSRPKIVDESIAVKSILRPPSKPIVQPPPNSSILGPLPNHTIKKDTSHPFVPSKQSCLKWTKTTK